MSDLCILPSFERASMTALRSERVNKYRKGYFQIDSTEIKKDNMSR